MVGYGHLPRSLTMPPESKTDQLIRVLTERIQSGVYPPGTQLPSNARLRESFGVSQMVVRLALDRLKERGLVETAPGRGVFVRERPKGELPDG
jgi:DNA-binding GntR family transcriptional regulator